MSVFDYANAFKKFIRDHPDITQQYKKNVIDNFICPTYYNVLDELFKEQTSFRMYSEKILKQYYLNLQTKGIMNKSLSNGSSYMVKVFFHKDNVLLLSCSLEIEPNHIEIHDVCVGKNHSGNGYCKTYIPILVEHIAKTYPQGKIQTMCIANNIAAYKCFTTVFGIPKTIKKGNLNVVEFEMTYN